MKEITKKIKERSEEVGGKLREQTAGYITAALGIVAGLAWNDAIKSLIEYLFPISKNTVFARFIYAILITFVVILMSRWLLLFLERKSPNKKEGK